MNSAEHKAEAERHLRSAWASSPQHRENHLAAANAHAALAALPDPVESEDDEATS